MSWHRLTLRIALALLVIALGMVLFCPKARSQDVRHGERLAKTWCVSCHSVDINGAELRNEAVPSFSSIANDLTNSQRSLETYLNSSHPRMPAYGITRAEVRDLAAYIMSLRTAGGGLPADRKASPRRSPPE